METNKAKSLTQILNKVKTGIKILVAGGAIVLLLGGVGCAPVPPNNGWGDIPSEYTIEGIPNVKQVALSTSFSVAAEMAFKSLGVDVDWLELIPIIQDGTYQNIDALVEYAKNKGFNSGSYHIDIGDTLNLISREVRIVAQTTHTPEDASPICKVPFGYKIKEEEIYLKDPWTGGDITILFDDFSKYTQGFDDMDDWTAVLIYDKNMSIDDLDLIPFSYSYKPVEDKKGLETSVKEASQDYFGKEIIDNGEKKFNQLSENKDNNKPKYNNSNNLGKKVSQNYNSANTRARI